MERGQTCSLKEFHCVGEVLIDTDRWSGFFDDETHVFLAQRYDQRAQTKPASVNAATAAASAHFSTSGPEDKLLLKTHSQMLHCFGRWKVKAFPKCASSRALMTQARYVVVSTPSTFKNSTNSEHSSATFVIESGLFVMFSSTYLMKLAKALFLASESRLSSSATLYSKCIAERLAKKRTGSMSGDIMHLLPTGLRVQSQVEISPPF